MQDYKHLIDDEPELKASDVLGALAIFVATALLTLCAYLIGC